MTACRAAPRRAAPRPLARASKRLLAGGRACTREEKREAPAPLSGALQEGAEEGRGG